MIQHFPKKATPTPIQEEYIKIIDDGFKDNKIVLLVAPTGSGKSFIGATVANSSKPVSQVYRNDILDYSVYNPNHDGLDFEGSTVLTVTKNLQDQYNGFFSDYAVFKGKSNYVCEIDPNFPVDVAPCVSTKKLIKKCWAGDICPYYKARNAALSSQTSVMNYAAYLSLQPKLQRRDILVLDEASELEKELVSRLTCRINRKQISRFLDVKVKKPGKDLFSWVNGILNSLNGFIDKEVAKKKKTSAVLIKVASNIIESLNRVVNYFESNFVVSYEDDDNIIILTPLYVDKFFNELVLQNTNKVLLMSATIMNPKAYMKRLGVTDFKLIEMPSTFNPAKSPIICSNLVKLNRTNQDRAVVKLIPTIQQICDKFRKHKGIIHTHSLAITNILKQYLKEDRFLFRDENNNNDDILEIHKNIDRPTVLVSPSMTHGIDLKGDLSRFQIIVKAPYLSLGDPRTSHWFEKDSDWYTEQMLSTVVQMAGRSVRSADDYCFTFILDGKITETILNYKNMLPKEFVNRIK